MKIVKKLLIIIFAIIILLPILLYASIVITNNCIADKIETDLVKYQTPAKTEIVDSISIPGKLTGNGNGMQYMGSILVKSDLSENELLNYYGSAFEFIEVREQKSAKIDFINKRNHSFNATIEEDGDTYYSITCWDSNRSEIFSDFLDFDLRGH